MPERSVVVASAIGLHARPASLFAEAASRITPTVTLTSSRGRSVLAASILGILSLGIEHGETVTLSADGDGADDALAVLGDMLERDLERE